MNIVVCIKQVPDTTEIKLDPVKGTLIRDGVPSIMNPDDKGGLEEALKLKDAYGAHVTVITMGPPQAEAILREAYAMGADRAILLTDRKFGGADTLATSYTLAAALKKLDADLVIAGRQAIDGDTAQVGPEIAELLGLPQVSYVKELAYDKSSKSLTIKRAVEDGYYLLKVTLPALITVLAEANKPRYMRVKGIIETYDREVEVWSFDDIDVDPACIGLAGSPTKVKRAFTKGVKEPGVLHEVDAREAANIILEKLKEKFIF
ncbi:electron transfer flavoprotein subunit beta/FixA family protein [Treponema phagedenis]|uniref:Electron transfer flavoprotein subunit beta n=1 Tax=Treponema phagedenis TaxID=162 RepID=A0A0B7GYW9_TREPH|nr:electron transfer flavoprotein subunit beta/FixA family protein [Treponema phagedenis]NVP24264.1 electron transfer flavoprotein subunit beta/FixA family protein [Treponema phagedenis]QEJ94237.1 electron transfer flavoprotein subunit beta/FixA family protein [Treponema phagedenis]QEJ99176.1 electron transfer flavoprotein subunit beta/FixA family protein [Treponema phagedenis]QEK00196.1 electron transfer flavoprotein subunit beta/FixA family protein [Treponema phagedenis]QEK04704.1 electron t